jgi:Tfp pilus assembly protein PilN
VALGAGRSQGTAYAIPVVLAGLAVLIFLYGSARHQIQSRTAQAAAITAQVAEANSEAARLAPFTSFVSLRQQRESAVAELVNARFDWAHSFHELGRVLPTGVWLTAINGTVGSATSSTSSSPASAGTVTSATPPGTVPTFNLSGCASSQSQVALTLNRLRLIDGVSAVTLQASGHSATGGSVSGECKTNFTVELTFDALPTSAAITSATAAATADHNVANTAGGGK